MLYDDFEAFKNPNRLDEAIRPRSFIPRSFSEQWSEVFFRSNGSSGFLRQQHSITSRQGFQTESAIWKILNTPRGTNATYDISRRPLKTSKIVGSEEKIERSIAHFGDFYRLVSTRKSLYKKKMFSKKSIKIKN